MQKRIDLIWTPSGTREDIPAGSPSIEMALISV